MLSDVEKLPIGLVGVRPNSRPTELRRSIRSLVADQPGRPLGVVQSERERLHQISRIIEGVMACLIDVSDCPGPIEFFDVMELVGRLEFAVDSIRLMSGASE